MFAFSKDQTIGWVFSSPYQGGPKSSSKKDLIGHVQATADALQLLTRGNLVDFADFPGQVIVKGYRFGSHPQICWVVLTSKTHHVFSLLSGYPSTIFVAGFLLKIQKKTKSKKLNSFLRLFTKKNMAAQKYLVLFFWCLNFAGWKPTRNFFSFSLSSPSVKLRWTSTGYVLSTGSRDHHILHRDVRQPAPFMSHLLRNGEAALAFLFCC